MRKYIQILMLILLCGCDIFSLRDAEPPDKPPLWYNFYTTWQLALKNLEYGYEDKRNVVKYGDLFMTNFRFYFSQQDINDYNISGTWTRDNEKDMLYSLNNWADSVRIELQTIPAQEDDTLSIPIRIYRKYTITAKHNLETRTFAGKMELQMVQDNGFWRILNWYDYRIVSSPILPSWGKLKYDFSA
jgi:hypothetical protein